MPDTIKKKLVLVVSASTKAAEKALKKFQGFLGKLGDFIKKWSKLAAIALAALGVAAVKMAVAVEKGIAEISTLGSFTIKQMKGMRSSLLGMSKEFGSTMKNLVRGQYDVISAGFTNVSDSIKIMTAANMAAIAGVTDVRTSTNLLLDVLKAYGLEAERVTDVSDVLFQTIKFGRTTFTELGASLGDILATAKIAGVSFQEVGAAMAALTGAGIKTVEATTALDRLMLGLAAPLSETAVELRKMGLQTTDAEGRILDLAEVLGQFVGMPLERLRKFFPGVREMKAAAALSSSLENMVKFLREMKRGGGAQAEAFAKMAETTSVKFAKAVSGLKVALINMGEVVIPILTKMLDLANSTIEVLAREGFVRGMISLSSRGAGRGTAGEGGGGGGGQILQLPPGMSLPEQQQFNIRTGVGGAIADIGGAAGGTRRVRNFGQFQGQRGQEFRNLEMRRFGRRGGGPIGGGVAIGGPSPVEGGGGGGPIGGIEQFTQKQIAAFKTIQGVAVSAANVVSLAWAGSFNAMLTGTANVAQGMTAIWRNTVNAILGMIAEMAAKMAIFGLLRLGTSIFLPGSAGVAGVIGGALHQASGGGSMTKFLGFGDVPVMGPTLANRPGGGGMGSSGGGGGGVQVFIGEDEIQNVVIRQVQDGMDNGELR